MNKAVQDAKDMVAVMPGLKEDALLALGSCAVCGKPLLDAGSATFYVLEISRAIFDQAALRRRLGAEMLMGAPVLARVMGPNEDLAKVFDGPVRVAMHESCALAHTHPAELMAAARRREGK